MSDACEAKAGHTHTHTHARAILSRQNGDCGVHDVRDCHALTVSQTPFSSLVGGTKAASSGQPDD